MSIPLEEGKIYTDGILGNWRRWGLCEKHMCPQVGIIKLPSKSHRKRKETRTLDSDLIRHQRASHAKTPAPSPNNTRVRVYLEDGVAEKSAISAG